jgi:hypothetical protein
MCCTDISQTYPEYLLFCNIPISEPPGGLGSQEALGEHFWLVLGSLVKRTEKTMVLLI